MRSLDNPLDQRHAAYSHNEGEDDGRRHQIGEESSPQRRPPGGDHYTSNR